MTEMTALAGWLILSLLGGLGLGRAVRHHRITRAERSIERLNRKDTGAVKKANALAQRKLRDLDREMSQPERNLRSRLDKLEARERAVTQQSEARQKEIRDAHGQRVREAAQEMEKRIKALDTEARNRMAGKSKGAAKDFPAYQRARGSGYRDGRKPTEAEVQSLIAEKFGL